MKLSPLVAVSLIFTAILSPASAGITFGPIRGHAGESIRLVTHSESTGGAIERTAGGKVSKGTISISRDRDLVWTFRDPAPDGTRRGMVRADKITTASTIRIDGREEKSADESPLTGKMFAMAKSPAGDWKFELDGSVPLTRIQIEIDELAVYLKRDWYPQREVNVGDSWEFDPAWIKLIVERDLANAQTIGTMRLRQVRRAANRQAAVIDITIRSSGGDFKADGSQTAATVDLTGEVIVNLDTMLDESLELKGTVTTGTSKAGESAKVILPVRLTVTKSFVRNWSADRASALRGNPICHQNRNNFALCFSSSFG